MKVSIDLENLEKLIKETIETNIENVVKEQVTETVEKIAEDLAGKEIRDAVSENFRRFVDEYIATTKIKVGGGYWSSEKEKEYTVEQYIKKELKDRLDSNAIKINDYEKLSFEQYIKRGLNYDDMIKRELDGFIDDVRKQINASMKENFNNATKAMLSNTVLNILNANETFKKIEDNIKCIADKQE